MEGIPHPIPRTVEEVFSDFKGRRAGLIRALTTGSLLFPFSCLITSCFCFCFDLQVTTNFLFFVSIFCAVADVEKFYQQCDPGGFAFSFGLIVLFPLLFLMFLTLP